MFLTTIRTFIVILLVFGVTSTGLALSPDIQAERYLLAAIKKNEAGDYRGAKEYFDKIVALDVGVPVNFYFQYGRVLNKTGNYDKAYSQLEYYINQAGRSGKYYMEALEEFTLADEELQKINAIRLKNQKEKEKKDRIKQEAREKKQRMIKGIKDKLLYGEWTGCANKRMSIFKFEADGTCEKKIHDDDYDRSTESCRWRLNADELIITSSSGYRFVDKVQDISESKLSLQKNGSWEVENAFSFIRTSSCR